MFYNKNCLQYYNIIQTFITTNVSYLHLGTLTLSLTCADLELQSDSLSYSKNMPNIWNKQAICEPTLRTKTKLVVISLSERAQNFYLKAGKVQEAITMHLHNKNWDAAEQIAM